MLQIPGHLKKFFRNKPASPDLISKTERELGQTFPPQLREFYLLHNGYGYTPFVDELDGLEPEPTDSLEELEFSYSKEQSDYNPTNTDDCRTLEAIASCFDTDPTVDFYAFMSLQERRGIAEVPAWLLIIGLVYGGDWTQLCISVREEDYGVIYMYNLSMHWEMDEDDFEMEPLMPLWFVSPSLQEFFDKLRVNKVY